MLRRQTGKGKFNEALLLWVHYGVVPKGLLTFLGFLGKALEETSGVQWTPEVIKKKKIAVVFVTASDAMDFLEGLPIVSCSWDKNPTV